MDACLLLAGLPKPSSPVRVKNADDLLEQRLQELEQTTFSQSIGSAHAKDAVQPHDLSGQSLPVKLRYLAACLQSLHAVESQPNLPTSNDSLLNFNAVSTLSEIIIEWGFRNAQPPISLLAASEFARIITEPHKSLSRSESSWLRHFLISKYLGNLYACLLKHASSKKQTTPRESTSPTTDCDGFANLINSARINQSDSLVSIAQSKLADLVDTIDPSKSISFLLKLMNSKGSAITGQFLTRAMLRPTGLQSLILLFVKSDLDRQGGLAVGPEFDAQLRALSRIITTVPKQCVDDEAYLKHIGPQLVHLIEQRHSPGSPLLHATISITTQLLHKFTQPTKLHIIYPLLSPLNTLFSTTSSRLKHDLEFGVDLDGHRILSSEDAVERVLSNATKFLALSEPSFELMDALHSVFIPLYLYHEFTSTHPLVSKAHAEAIDMKEVLKALLRMNVVEKSELLLSEMVTFGESLADDVNGMPVISANLGASGRVQFILRDDAEAHASGASLISDANVFVEFLTHLEDKQLVCGVFLRLLEHYIVSSSGVRETEELSTNLRTVVTMRILMILIERFGADLIQGTRRIFELVRSIVVNSSVEGSVDSACLLLCLTISKGVLNNLDSETTDIKKLFDLDEFVVVLQTLETHQDAGIRAVAKDVRRLIFIKSGGDSRDAVSAERHASEVLFARSMLELSDELLPIRAHGMDHIRKMVLSQDVVVQENLNTVLFAYLDMVQDVDSFIYLHAVAGLSTLADVYPKQCLEQIVTRYSNTEDYPTDYRLRIGEVASKTIKRSGPVFGKYAPEILPPILKVLRDKDPHMRASAISLLGVVAETAPLPLLPYIQQILDFIENTLILEQSDAILRQGAVLALLCFIRGMHGMYSTFPKGTLRRVFTRLKIVSETDNDELTRHNAGIALDELRDAIGLF
ncbi:transmembrane and coiled-coil domains-containing protein 7 [Chytriomyces hyalinus]|nr:transmembrane and coiled-coil domains-containing protein 7 [Chytriomyces hyalinus]